MVTWPDAWNGVVPAADRSAERAAWLFTPSSGVKEFWRTGIVAGATSYLDNVTTSDEFEADWVESQQDC